MIVFEEGNVLRNVPNEYVSSKGKEIISIFVMPRDKFIRSLLSRLYARDSYINDSSNILNPIMMLGKLTLKEAESILRQSLLV